MKCRHCKNQDLMPFVDLGSAPPSNSYLTTETLSSPENWFPLRVFTCNKCWLVQTEDFAGFEELFDDNYAYFSSFSQSWLEHSKQFVGMAIDAFKLNGDSMIVEVAANDGYLLQFAKASGIPCYGIEPTRSTADAARAKGIEIVEEFFGEALGASLAQNQRSADLTVANNVLAHVPDIVDFAKGFEKLLKPDGVACFEFPHVLNLVTKNQFDTIYHEHFSYLSALAVKEVFLTAGLSLFDAEKLPTHGGSLRVFAQRAASGQKPSTARLQSLLDEEIEAGMQNGSFYQSFQQQTETVKNDFLQFLLRARQEGKSVCGYGAAAKGNTLLNYAGVRPDLLSFVVDKNPSKQNKYMPGSRIPILDPSAIEREKPDYIVILPWNIADEVRRQLDYCGGWGGQFVIAVPELTVLR